MQYTPLLIEMAFFFVMMTVGGFMDANRIIADIDIKISKLQQARALLSGVAVKKGPGRPKSVESQVAKPRKRKLSAKARAAISAAMKARWAKVKKVTKPTATKINSKP
jgi:hypothetical protein